MPPCNTGSGLRDQNLFGFYSFSTGAATRARFIISTKLPPCDPRAGPSFIWGWGSAVVEGMIQHGVTMGDSEYQQRVNVSGL
ncbi:MAG TPA: hypothetical protein EYQ50_23365 [Verrucomicrobiales bacterium]|nr:hypothetical protein [Verrucomicrobiales bacterium]